MKAPARHRFFTLLVGVALITIGLLAVTARTVIFPREDPAAQSDAIIVLGGLNSAVVVARAVELAKSGYSSHVLISDAFGGDTRPTHLCQRTVPVPGTAISVECFNPQPATTGGEAEAIAHFAARRGWTSVIVVTASYHVSRARVQVSQCYTGHLAVVGARQQMDTSDWAYQFLYQSAGFIKTWAEPTC